MFVVSNVYSNSMGDDNTPQIEVQLTYLLVIILLINSLELLPRTTRVRQRTYRNEQGN